MRAVVVGAGGTTSVVDVPVPRPGPGEVLLRLRGCGLCGTDLYKLEHDLVPPGTVLGHEIVGTAVAIGAGVDSVAPGQRVVAPHHVACGSCRLCGTGSDTRCPLFTGENLMVPGGFAEYVLLRSRVVERALWLPPDRVSDEAASMMEPAACVLRGLLRGRASGSGDGGVLAVVGGGGMGLLHVLVLRAFAPRAMVVVSDPIANRRELARGLGARAGVSPDELADTVRDLSAGTGADAVFDTVGGPEVFRQALGVLRPGGSAVLFAHAGAGVRADFVLDPFFRAEQRVVATYSGGLAEQRLVAEAITDGRLDPAPLVTRRLPLERFGEAVDLARGRRELKVLLVPAAGAT